jgi:hypothetical protein
MYGNFYFLTSHSATPVWNFLAVDKMVGTDLDLDPVMYFKITVRICRSINYGSGGSLNTDLLSFNSARCRSAL